AHGLESPTRLVGLPLSDDESAEGVWPAAQSATAAILSSPLPSSSATSPSASTASSSLCKSNSWANRLWFGRWFLQATMVPNTRIRAYSKGSQAMAAAVTHKVKHKFLEALSVATSQLLNFRVPCNHQSLSSWPSVPHLAEKSTIQHPPPTGNS
ncbi:unnamed protein product, partial [Ectocarpus sp. 12 AP-2014]